VNATSPTSSIDTDVICPAPMVWGTLADRIGRRPLFLLCLFLLSASCVGLALVPTNAYWLLMVLRCLQAAGSASTIALCWFHVIPNLDGRTELMYSGWMHGRYRNACREGRLLRLLWNRNPSWTSNWARDRRTVSISLITLVLSRLTTIVRLAQGLGWRSIFWFMCIASASALILTYLYANCSLIRASISNFS
jgi:MFS family permease